MGDTVAVQFASGPRTELGTSVAVLSAGGWSFTNAQGEDVTFCYDPVLVNEGSLTVVKRKITIVPFGNYQEYYNGAAIVNNGYEVQNFLYDIGHTITFTVYGSQTNVGSSEATVDFESIVIKDKNGVDAIGYYEIYTETASLLVEKKRPISVTTASEVFVYDAQAHKNENYVLTDICPVPMIRTEEMFAYFDNDVMVLPGAYTNKLVVKVFIKGTNNETTSNYEFIEDFGTITITGVEIEVITEGGEKIYDGTPLKVEGATFNFISTAFEGLDIQIVTTGEQTDVGVSYNTYEIVATYNGQPFPTGGIDVVRESLGELKVTPLVITIHTESASKTYDGAPLKHPVFTSDFDSFEASKNLTLSVSTAMLIDIGRRDNEITSVQLLDQNGIPVSRDNFVVSEESTFGTLTMYAGLIVIESDRDAFEYDGTPKSCPNHKSPEGHINGYHTVKSYNYQSFVEVGEHENTFSVVIVDKDGNSMMEFYPNIELKWDKVRITKRKIEIEAPTVVERYEEGKVIYAPNEIVTPNEYLDKLNDNMNGNVYGYEIDCDMSTIAYATEMGVDVEYSIPKEHFYITLNGKRLDMENFEVESLPGYLRFSDKLIEIEIFEVIGYYDGDRLEYFEDDWDIEDGQLPDGCWLELDLSGIGLSEAGTIDFDEVLTYLLDSGKLCMYRYHESGRLEDVTHLYEFKLVGTPLTLKKAELVLTAGSATKFYDGSPLTNNTYTITGGCLAQGHVITVCEISGTITEIGEEDNTITKVVIVDTLNKDDKGKPIDVTENYRITVIKGVLTVEKDNQ